MKRIITIMAGLIIAGCSREQTITLPEIPACWRGRCVDYFMRDFVTIDSRGHLWTGITLPGAWEEGVHSLRGARLITLPELQSKLTETARNSGPLAAEIIADADLQCGLFFPVLETLSGHGTHAAFFRLGGHGRTGGAHFSPQMPTNLHHAVVLECFASNIVINGRSLSDPETQTLIDRFEHDSHIQGTDKKTFVVIPDEAVQIQRLVAILSECDKATDLGRVHLVRRRPETKRDVAQPPEPPYGATRAAGAP